MTTAAEEKAREAGETEAPSVSPLTVETGPAPMPPGHMLVVKTPAPDGSPPSTLKSRGSPRPPTDEEIGRTYTGLDREIAEEFIAIAMDPGAQREKQARTNSDTMSTESTRLSDK